MITIKTPHGLIELPRIAPDDTQTVQGNCEHGVSLFRPCFDCRWIESYFDHLKLQFQDEIHSDMNQPEVTIEAPLL